MAVYQLEVRIGGNKLLCAVVSVHGSILACIRAIIDFQTPVEWLSRETECSIYVFTIFKCAHNRREYLFMMSFSRNGMLFILV